MFRRAVLAILCSLFTLEAGGQEVAPGEQLPLPEPPYQRARLESGFGHAEFPITCRRELSQLYFNQGIAMLHGFDLRGADRSFHQVAKLEPDCAMAYWGMAMANSGNEKRAKGFVAEAVKRKDGASKRERMYIDALNNYIEQGKGKKKQRAEKLTKALENIVHEFPDDVEAKAFLAKLP